MFTDNFNTSSLNPNWLKPVGVPDKFIIQSGSVITGGIHSTTLTIAYYNSNLTENHSSKIQVISASVSHTDLGPCVQIQSGSYSFYVLDYGEQANTIKFYKCVSGSFSVLNIISTTIGSTDTLKLNISGNILSAYVNDIAVGSVTDTGPLLQGGYSGIYIYGDSAVADNWTGSAISPTNNNITLYVLPNKHSGFFI